MRLLRPGSAAGYLVEQARALIDDLALAPVRSKRKVYILDSADQLGASAANALLKSLEEPPGNVTFVLIAPTRASVLPTVASRCQAVPFKPASPEASSAELAQELGVPAELARRAVACCPSPEQARGLIVSDARQQARRAALDCLAALPAADGLGVLRLARAAAEAAEAPVEELRQKQEQALADESRLLSDSAAKALKERQKREAALCRREEASEQLGAVRSLLRDALCRAAGCGERLSCDDYAGASAELATRLGCEGAARALGAAARAESLIRGNVSPQLAFEAMLIEIKEMIACRP